MHLAFEDARRREHSSSGNENGFLITAAGPSYPASNLLLNMGVGDSSLTLVPSIAVGIGPGTYLRIDLEVMLVTSVSSNVVLVAPAASLLCYVVRKHRQTLHWYVLRFLCGAGKKMI